MTSTEFLPTGSAPAGSLPANPSGRPNRIESIDILRGLVMIVMALDHARDYFHADAFLFSPTDLGKTSVFLFFTRWVTHFCAPVFMLLTGSAAFLVGEKKGRGALSKFLFTRGLFLVVMELTVVNFAWNFNIHFPEVDLLVIWSLGISMIFLSGLVYFPSQVILWTGLILVFGHNLLDGVHVAGGGAAAFAWSVLHEPGTFHFGGETFVVLFPLVPWIGVIALGYMTGSLYARGVDPAFRRKILLRLGIGALTLFLLLRSGNLYGDAAHWSPQTSAAFSLLSFLNVSKYPPSLLYLLVTIGPAFIFLALSEKKPGRWGRVLAVYGRVPMFYYILHIYLIHLLALFATLLCGHKMSDMVWDDFDNLAKLTGYGFPLWVVYAVWVVVVAALYPLCKWYDRYKAAHREKWWLSYL